MANRESSNEEDRRIDSPSANEKIKSTEAAIIRHVDLSCLASEDGRYELALTRASKAQEALESLRALTLQEQRAGSSLSYNSSQRKTGDSANGSANEDSSPLTTTVNLFELMLMVRSNLATQMSRVGRLEDALDIYMQLCRFANNPNASGYRLSSASSKQEVAKLLFKFGLNIGNVLFEMKDYPRALKYYRLTLDRLSSSSQRNFRVKLMSNISTTLIMLKESDPSRSNSSDHLTSLNLLLSDNVDQTSGQVRNANHYKFGLNLIVSRYEKRDLRGMANVYKSLVGTNLGPHYSRIHLSSTEQNKQEIVKEKLDQEIESILRSRWQIFPAPMRSALAGSASSSVSSSSKRRYRFDGGEGTEIVTPTVSLEDSKQVGHGEKESETTNFSAAQWIKCVVNATKDDNLESYIREKEELIRQCLVAGCNLMYDLESEERKTDDESDVMQTLRADGIGSVDLYAIKLLESSSLHKNLALDIRMNRIVQSLSKRYRLNESIRLLRHLEEDVARHKNERAMTGRQRYKLIDSGLSSADYRNVSSPANNQQMPLEESSLIESNLAVFKIMHDTEKSDSIKKAFLLDSLHADSWVNLACHYQMTDDLERAFVCLRQALSIEPNHWQGLYNLMIVCRKANQQIDWPKIWDGLFGAQRNDLQRTLNSQVFENLILEIVQVLMTLQKNGMRNDKLNIVLKVLLNCSRRHSPELYLLLSRSIKGHASSYENDAKMTPASILQLASRIHPYHFSFTGINAEIHH